jgi:fructose-1,6-bisphosphatase II
MKALGGLIQTILHPTDDEQKQRGLDAGLRFDHVYDADELVRSEDTYFVATGVTDGQLVAGVRRLGPVIRTESIVLRSRSGTIRRVQADHLAKKWLDE